MLSRFIMIFQACEFYFALILGIPNFNLSSVETQICIGSLLHSCSYISAEIFLLQYLDLKSMYLPEVLNSLLVTSLKSGSILFYGLYMKQQLWYRFVKPDSIMILLLCLYGQCRILLCIIYHHSQKENLECSSSQVSQKWRKYNRSQTDFFSDSE